MVRSPDKLWGQKLAPPHATFPVVHRVRASERVAEQESVSLVLVSAPAGFGKTALLRSLYEQRRDDGEHVIWLSLDAADNDPQRFLEYLDAALEAPAANGGVCANVNGTAQAGGRG